MSEENTITDTEVITNIGQGFMVLYQYNKRWHMKTATYGYPYGFEWSAIRYGNPSNHYKHIKNWCVMNMTNGLIVWRSWEQPSP